MLQVQFTHEERSQLGGWARREDHYLLAMRSMARMIVAPKVSGTLDSIHNDYDFIDRIRSSIHDHNDITILSEEDADHLLLIAQANRLPDKTMFWKSVEKKLQEASLRGGS